MDRTCAILQALTRWIGEHEDLPIIYAAFQQSRSCNSPEQPLLGLVLQDGAGMNGWTIGGRQYPFPDLHAAILHTHQGSSSDAPTGRGGIWLTSLDMRGVTAFDELLQGYGFPAFPIGNPAALRRVYRRIIELHTRPQLATRVLHLRAAWLELIACLLDEIAGQSDRARLDPPPPVQRVLAFIAAQYQDPTLGLPELARAANLDRHHLGRLFKRYTGSPPMQYLRDYRLQQARYLLGTTDLRVAEVAAACGFADPLHFSRLFRRATGSSPSGHRAAQYTPSTTAVVEEAKGRTSATPSQG